MASLVRFAANASSSGSLDFDMPEDGRYIVLPVRLNNMCVDALVDSGVRATALDQSLARELRLQSSGAFTAVGVCGLAAGRWTERLTVGIGTVTVSIPEPAVLDFSGLNVATARPIVAV